MCDHKDEEKKKCTCEGKDCKKSGTSCCQTDDKEKKPCNCKTEVYSRVVGYIRPTDDWNDAKKDEFDDRKTYDVDRDKDSNDNDDECGDAD